MCAIQGSQAAFLFQLAQALEDFGVGIGVAFFHGLLMGIGARFPLLAHRTFTFFQVFEQFRCFCGIDGSANTVIKIGFTQQKSDAVSLEIYLCKSGFVVTGKTSGADGLNLANSMVGMMNAVALGKSNKPSP